MKLKLGVADIIITLIMINVVLITTKTIVMHTNVSKVYFKCRPGFASNIPSNT